MSKVPILPWLKSKIYFRQNELWTWFEVRWIADTLGYPTHLESRSHTLLRAKNLSLTAPKGHILRYSWTFASISVTRFIKEYKCSLNSATSTTYFLSCYILLPLLRASKNPLRCISKTSVTPLYHLHTLSQHTFRCKGATVNIQGEWPAQKCEQLGEPGKWMQHFLSKEQKKPAKFPRPKSKEECN